MKCTVYAKKVIDWIFVPAKNAPREYYKNKDIYSRLLVIYATEVVWTAQHIISTVRWKLVGICQSSLHRSKNSFLQNGIFLKRRIYLGLQIIRSVDLPNFCCYQYSFYYMYFICVMNTSSSHVSSNTSKRNKFSYSFNTPMALLSIYIASLKMINIYIFFKFRPIRSCVGRLGKILAPMDIKMLVFRVSNGWT